MTDQTAGHTCGSLSLPTYSGEVVCCVLATGHERQCQSATEYPYVSWPNPSNGAWHRAAAGVRDAARQASGQQPAAVAYGDGKGRVYCLGCANTVGATVPLTVNVVDHWEECPSCGRHVVDVARQQPAGQPADPTTADDPVALRWGLNDVLWGDDDTITVCMSGPDREPYWLELTPDQAAILRDDLAGPDSAAAEDTIGLCGYCGVPKESHHHGYVSTEAASAAAPHRITAAVGGQDATQPTTETRARARLTALIGYEPGEHDTEFEQHLDAYRAAILNSAARAAESERLHEDLHTPEDEAYNEAVTDTVTAIRRLAAGSES